MTVLAWLHRPLFGVEVSAVLLTALDLALVYLLIYRVLLAIRGTRAAAMMVGLVLIGAAFYAAERLELTTISWLLDNLFSYFIILFIVVFQQDIRRALGRLGQNVWPLGRRNASAVAIEEVIAAVTQMAHTRTGALIVFERQANLAPYVLDTAPLDAELSRQLLLTLFVPVKENELHDGAVIINTRGRIAYARALLPLSKDGDLGPEFGTRHRAALGITEDTDAVALAVSEERGEVSLCVRGSIARDLEPATLRRALTGLLAGARGSDIAAQAQAAAYVARALASLGDRRGEPLDREPRLAPEAPTEPAARARRPAAQAAASQIAPSDDTTVRTEAAVEAGTASPGPHAGTAP